MKIGSDDYSLRTLVLEDAPALARHADDPLISAHMRDRFPHPYAEADAVAFIEILGARRVWAGVFAGNPASERMLAKAG